MVVKHDVKWIQGCRRYKIKFGLAKNVPCSISDVNDQMHLQENTYGEWFCHWEDGVALVMLTWIIELPHIFKHLGHGSYLNVSNYVCNLNHQVDSELQKDATSLDKTWMSEIIAGLQKQGTTVHMVLDNWQFDNCTVYKAVN